MKRLTIFGIIACVGLLFAPAAVIGAGPPPAGLNVNVTNTPLPVTVQPNGLSVNVSTVYQFAGYTTKTTTGDADGVLGMHALCTEFGALARMCTSREYWTTPGVTPEVEAPDGMSAAAWIQPSVVGVTLGTGTVVGTTYAIDFSGAVLEMFLGFDVPTCTRWLSQGNQINGTIVGTKNGFISGNAVCSDEHRVACCAPANQ